MWKAQSGRPKIDASTGRGGVHLRTPCHTTPLATSQSKVTREGSCQPNDTTATSRPPFDNLETMSRAPSASQAFSLQSHNSGIPVGGQVTSAHVRIASGARDGSTHHECWFDSRSTKEIKCETHKYRGKRIRWSFLSVLALVAAQDRYTVKLPNGLYSLSSEGTKTGRLSLPVRPTRKT